MPENFPMDEVISRLSLEFIKISESAAQGENKVGEYMPDFVRLEGQLGLYLRQGPQVPHFEKLSAIRNFLKQFITRFGNNPVSIEREKALHEIKTHLDGAYVRRNGHNGHHPVQPPMPDDPGPIPQSAVQAYKGTADYQKLKNPAAVDPAEYVESTEERHIREEFSQYRNASFWMGRLFRVCLWGGIILLLLAGISRVIPTNQSAPRLSPGALPPSARTVGQIYFEIGKSALTEHQKDVIAGLKGAITAPGVKLIFIQGHADPQRFAEGDGNWDLSYKRSRTVMEYLHANFGIPYEKFRLASASYYDAKSAKEDDYWKERRVQIYLVTK